MGYLYVSIVSKGSDHVASDDVATAMAMKMMN